MTAEQAGRQWKTLAPLFRDPVYDGCSDPTVVYNQEENSWWMFYTQRRASLPVVGVSGSFGTEVGIASSPDGGKTWVYRGTAQGLSIDWGHNTFWAPEVFFDKKSWTIPHDRHVYAGSAASLGTLRRKMRNGSLYQPQPVRMEVLQFCIWQAAFRHH